MSIKTNYGERTYSFVDGHAWDGAHWKGDKDFPFATGHVYAGWNEPNITNPETSFEVHQDLITYNTEHNGLKYEIYEKIEGQDRRRHLTSTWTTTGAKKVIQKRVNDVVNQLVAEMATDLLRKGM